MNCLLSQSGSQILRLPLAHRGMLSVNRAIDLRDIYLEHGRGKEQQAQQDAGQTGDR